MPVVRFRRLHIEGSSSDTATTFYRKDLEEVRSQAGATDIELRLATCYMKMGHKDTSFDKRKDMKGYQHVVAVAVNGKVPLTDEKLHVAALPCPPHCGGKKYSAEERIRFDTYKYTKPSIPHG